MVDADRLDEVLEHHRHVLYSAPRPQWFDLTTSDTSRSAGSTPKTMTHPAHVLPVNTSRMTADARQRRYGH
jgi:hypothetical protein